VEPDSGMVGHNHKGVACMTKFGDWPSTGVTPVGEQFLIISPQVYCGAGENLWGMGWYTMPFAGHLTVELWAEVDWNGDNAPGIWFSVGQGSSPAPNGGATDLGECRHGINIFKPAAEMRASAYWLNLGAGAGVYAHARIYSTEAGHVAVRFVAGFYRPMPA
jgi:hypothetical protein